MRSFLWVQEFSLLFGIWYHLTFSIENGTGYLDIQKQNAKKNQENTVFRTGCPGRWWSHHPWRCWRDMEMWQRKCGTEGHGIAGNTGERLDWMILEGFSSFSDSMIRFHYVNNFPLKSTFFATSQASQICQHIWRVLQASFLYRKIILALRSFILKHVKDYCSDCNLCVHLLRILSLLGK